MFNIGLTVLYIFFGVTQAYVLMFSGLKSHLKKIITSSGISTLNNLLYNFYIPVYSIIQLSHMSSIDNIKAYWPVFASIVICLLLRLGLAFLFNKVAGISLNTSNSYALLNTYPALGSLTLVLGQALCYDGCPLYGDMQCSNILGLMMVNYLFYSVIVFVIGYVIHCKSFKRYSLIKEKLKIVTHRFNLVTSRKDLFISYLINKYLDNASNKDEIYDLFVSDNCLSVDENFTYSLNKPKSKIEVMEVNDFSDIKAKSLHLYRSTKLCFSDYDFKTNSETNENSSQLNNSVYSNKKNSFISDKLKENNEKAFDLIIKYHKLTLKPAKLRSKSFSLPRVKTATEVSEKEYSDMFTKEKEILSTYYKNLFSFIESKINEEENKSNEVKNKLKMLNLEKEIILSDITKSLVPKFPISDKEPVNSKDLEVIDSLWVDYQNKVLVKKGISYSLPVEDIEVDYNFIFKKLFSPPIIGCIIGIFVGMSGMRDVIFSKNHFLLNFFELSFISSKSFTALLYYIVSCSLSESPSFNSNLNFSLTRKHMITNFIACFIIYPAIGLGFLSLYKGYIGGLVATSKVVRFTLFIPFGVPLTPNFLIVLNIVKRFFINEYSYMLKVHYIIQPFSCTLILLVYFMLIG